MSVSAETLAAHWLPEIVPLQTSEAGCVWPAAALAACCTHCLLHSQHKLAYCPSQVMLEAASCCGAGTRTALLASSVQAQEQSDRDGPYRSGEADRWPLGVQVP